MTGEDKPRRPRAFSLGDSRLTSPAPTQAETSASAPSSDKTAEPAIAPIPARTQRKGWSWGAIFFSALGALVSLALGLWVADFVGRLFAREDWLGYLALALAVIAAFAALMIILREALGFIRLARVASIRSEADTAILRGDKRLALSASQGVEALFSGRQELGWGTKRLREHRGDILDARELLILTERELLTPLDRQARVLIAASARRVSLITAVSPSAVLDVGFVAFENLGMLRRLATLYGGRPGFLGSLKLARLVMSHIALTGCVALGEDVVQQLIGHGLTARLSAKLGEGIMNGAFTGRIGIAAVELCRPLPFLELDRPRLRDVITELRSARRTETQPPAPSGVSGE